MPNYLDLYYQLNKCDFIFISECLKFNHTNPIFGILPFVLNLLSLTFMRPTHTTTYDIENKDVTKGQESPDIYMLKRETIWSSHSASSTQTPPLFPKNQTKGFWCYIQVYFHSLHTTIFKFTSILFTQPAKTSRCGDKWGSWDIQVST